LLQPWVDPNDFDTSLMIMKLNKTTKLAKMTECEQSNQINLYNFVTIDDILTCFLYPLEIKESLELYRCYCVWMGKQGKGTKGFTSSWYKAS
jgi:hypothetical protein